MKRVAAETLEEVDPKLQKALLEKLDEERIADIVEEMDPGAAADLLGELPEEQSDAILEEMEPEERQEVSELLEFDENSAAGCMTTDFVYLGMDATVAQAVQAFRSFDGDPDSVTEIYLLDEKRILRGAITLARLLMAQPETRLSVLPEPRILSCPADLSQNDLAELFDKYNLHALPVVDPRTAWSAWCRPTTSSVFCATSSNRPPHLAAIVRLCSVFVPLTQVISEKTSGFIWICERIQE